MTPGLVVRHGQGKALDPFSAKLRCGNSETSMF